MNHRNRGIALLININEFEDKAKCPTRLGSKQDLKRLEMTFGKSLGFKVLSFEDLKRNQIEKKLEEGKMKLFRLYLH